MWTNDFYDGHYYIEDVAAARISNLLSHQGVKLTDEQKVEIARTIMGAIAGYLIGRADYTDFFKCRVEKWELPIGGGND